MSTQGRTFPRVDRLPIQGGAVNLPATFRQVAQLANKAGLEGYAIADVIYGVNLEDARQWMTKVERTAPPGPEVAMLYRLAAETPAYAELLEACKMVKRFLTNLEDGTEAGDPLREIRQRFHAPLHAALDKAIQKAEPQS